MYCACRGGSPRAGGAYVTPRRGIVAYRAILLDGQVWTVRAVALPPRTAELVSRNPNAVTTWLSIVSDLEKRRIAPIPAGWEQWTDEQLMEAIRRAEVMVARSG